MEVIDRTKAVTQHFLENSFKKLSIKKKIKNEKSEKHKKYMFSKCLLRHDVVRVFVSSLVLFLYGPFFHGALKHDISTLFTTFFV